ncbi:MAG: hypothetical protein ACRD68_15505, partial [Pyrinomonadaceae bacterium]
MKSTACRHRGLTRRATIWLSAVGLLSLWPVFASHDTAAAAGRVFPRGGNQPPAFRLPNTFEGNPSGPVSRAGARRPTKRIARRVNWRLEKTTGDRPSARGAGKLVAVGSKLVAFSGFYECFDKSKCEHVYFDDVHILDLTTNRWERRMPASRTGALPAKRAFPGGTAYKKKNTAVFFGGSLYNVNMTSVRVHG